MNNTIKNTLLIIVGELLIIFNLLNQFLFKFSYVLSIVMIYAFMIGCISNLFMENLTLYHISVSLLIIVFVVFFGRCCG